MRESQGHQHNRERHYFKTLDRHLNAENLVEKVLTSAVIEGWLRSFPDDMNVNTKIVYISHYTQFAKFLGTLGISAFIPERPVDDKSYAPYVFSSDEVFRLFAAADNVSEDIQSKQCTGIDFPLILRLLYGCGLRLNEALSLCIADIDLQTGVLLIRSAKGNKDRIVPMDNSLTGIMQSFMSSRRANALPDSLLFTSRNGKPYSGITIRTWFNLTLEKAGIEKPSLPRYSRNICPHCLRHTFAGASFRKQDRAGIDMYAAAPYLSTYMGHDKIYGTEKYLHMTAENSEDVIEQTTSYSAGLFPEVPR
ncbi:MAG: tyrosine-type recombinase/integrase [Oscillospiraceae bacterium]|nr:tyrosine-type recombinase/integrase [Oscillospiraceae bacterium]